LFLISQERYSNESIYTKGMHPEQLNSPWQSLSLSLSLFIYYYFLYILIWFSAGSSSMFPISTDSKKKKKNNRRQRSKERRWLPHFIKTSWWWRATPGSNMLVLIFPNPFLFILIFKSWYLGNMIKALHAMGGRTYLPPPPFFFIRNFLSFNFLFGIFNNAYIKNLDVVKLIFTFRPCLLAWCINQSIY